ncbi:MAG: BolA family transcriptional regulator [Alphaproteobacteria bacterium]|nr:BolA family transcriptional regulator [Alphaproteobacteria bacterium]
MTPSSRQQRIKAILAERLAPTQLTITDDSHRHAGHAGAQPGGETHYTIAIISEAFCGLSRVARHRLVYDALKAEFAAGLHALSINTQTPEEASRIPGA